MEMAGKEAFSFDVESFRNFQPKVWQNAKNPCGILYLDYSLVALGVEGRGGGVGIDNKHC